MFPLAQWFGNLVTLRWWNEVWLNEGFASYVAHLGVDHAEPAWNVVRLHLDMPGPRSKQTEEPCMSARGQSWDRTGHGLIVST